MIVDESKLGDLDLTKLRPGEIISVSAEHNFGLPMYNRYLVTGGTGSFGRTMVDHLRKFAIVRVFSRDEAKQDQMRQELNDPNVEFWLGDVRDIDRVREAMRDVSFVFHAAALKQVPSCENWPMEAVKTNVIGADNVMRAAIEAGVLKCVLLSTDKAVYPVSAMGRSKAMMESLMLARAKEFSNTTICATRYGNVLGSRGSVVPLFCQQIKEKKQMTITDVAMTRFVMTLEESVSLVMYAFKHGRPGEIFIHPAHACHVIDLATALLTLVRTETRHPCSIGVRPGEKMHEWLISEEEAARVVSSDGFYRIRADGGCPVNSLGAYASNSAPRLGRWQLVDLLKTLPCVQEIMR